MSSRPLSTKRHRGTSLNNCDFEQAAFLIERLSGKWNVRVLAVICRLEGIQFNDIKRSLPGISQSTLALVLQNLERSGFVDRKKTDQSRLAAVKYSHGETTRLAEPIFRMIV